MVRVRSRHAADDILWRYGHATDAIVMQQFWKLIEDGHRQVPDPADGEQVAARATALQWAYPATRSLPPGMPSRIIP